MITVKYKRDKYKVSFKDATYINCIKIKLLAIRIWRRITNLVPSNGKLYIFLTLVWIAFGIGTYHMGIWYKNPVLYSVKDVIWELKNSYFTSVVLALFINSYNRNYNYSNVLKKQHNFYTDILHEFDELFIPFLNDEIYYYMVFYNEKCLQDTIDYLQTIGKMGKYSFKEKEFILLLDDTLETIKKIEEWDKSYGIIDVDQFGLYYDIRDIKKKIKKIKNSRITMSDALEFLVNETDTILCIIDELRRPWRKDINNDLKILNVLDKYAENQITEDFYYNMHLYGHKFE